MPTKAERYFFVPEKNWAEKAHYLKSPEQEAAFFDKCYRERGLNLPNVIGCRKVLWAGGGEPLYCYSPIYGVRQVGLRKVRQDVTQVQILSFGSLTWINDDERNFLVF